MAKIFSCSVLFSTVLVAALGCSDSDSNEGSAGSAGMAGSQAGAGGTNLGGGGMGGVPMGGAGSDAGGAGSGGMPMGGAGMTTGGGGSPVGADAGLSADAGETADSGLGGSDPAEPSQLVALTFDDGPNNDLTGAVLDKLEALQVPASFFLVGQNVNAGTQAILQRAADLGCEFENHSAGFNSLTGLSTQEIEQSIDSTSAAILDITGTTPQFFRPPNLAVDDTMRQAIDLPFAGGVLGGDFPGGNNGGNPSVQSVIDAVLGGVVDGSIILLHDVQPGLNPQVTPDALDTIVPTLQAQGFEFVTLRQLFARRGVDPSLQQDVLVGSVPPAN